LLERAKADIEEELARDPDKAVVEEERKVRRDNRR
jgi:hypothetical protein